MHPRRQLARVAPAGTDILTANLLANTRTSPTAAWPSPYAEAPSRTLKYRPAYPKTPFADLAGTILAATRGTSYTRRPRRGVREGGRGPFALGTGRALRLGRARTGRAVTERRPSRRWPIFGATWNAAPSRGRRRRHSQSGRDASPVPRCTDKLRVEAIDGPFDVGLPVGLEREKVTASQGGVLVSEDRKDAARTPPRSGCRRSS